MVWETWVQFQVALYQRLLKWHLIPPCLTLSNIRYISRVKLSNPGKGVAPSPKRRCRSYWKGSLLAAIDYGHQLYSLLHLETLSPRFSTIMNYIKEMLLLPEWWLANWHTVEAGFVESYLDEVPARLTCNVTTVNTLFLSFYFHFRINLEVFFGVSWQIL